MKRSLFVLAIAALACGLSFIPHVALADSVANGDFEEPPWLTGWTGTSAIEQNDPAIGGAASARFEAGQSGPITQAFEETLPGWQLDFDIVSEDPGGVDDRSLSAVLQRVNDSEAYRPLISYRINGDGDLQVHSGYWRTPSGLAGAINFVDDLTSTTEALLVHHVSIVGHFDQATPSYDITVTNSDDQVFQATELSYWSDSKVAPVEGDGLEGLNFSCTSIAGDYLVDNVTLDDGSSGDLPGDLNSDGFVGGDDLDIVRSFWGQDVTGGDLLSGDPSGDGFVGGDDLDIVRANWGQGTPPAPTAVPEPTSMVVILTGVLAAWILRRRG